MKILFYVLSSAAAVALMYVLFGFPVAPVSLERTVIDGTHASSSRPQEPQSAENQLAAYKGAELRYQSFRDLHLRVVLIAVFALALLCIVSWYAARKF